MSDRNAAAISDDIVSTLVIGAGFAGIGAAIRLQQRGIDDFVILERGDRPGGTWRDNTYPGAACDIPSRLYSFSFAPNPNWPHTYSRSADILAYIESMIDEHDLRRRIRFGHNVSGLCYDELSGTWEVSLAGRAPLRARAVVLASGPLSTPGYPAIEGIETYTGKRIHSADWDHDYDFAGKRVAVIGTGASAVQIIPELVRIAGHVTVYQRTPGWVLPRMNRRITPQMKSLYRAIPGAQSVARAGWYYGHESVALGVVWNTPLTRVVEEVAKAHLRAQVRDPWQRRQLTPNFRAGCKRLLISNDYYPALQRDNCRLVTWPIARICENGIRTAEGVERRFDAIVFATGFEVFKQGTPIPIIGRRGRNLAAEWSRGAYAYKSIAVSGYPNLYLTFGPNSGPGHNSALVYLEAQIEAIVTAISLILDRDLHSLDVFEPTQRKFNERLQKRLRYTTWNSGCQSWYITEDGFNPSMFPGFASQFIAQMRGIDFTRDFRAIANGSDEQVSRHRDTRPSRRVAPAPSPPVRRPPARAR